MGETSNHQQVKKHGTINAMKGTIVVRASNTSNEEQDGKYDSEYVDATQMEEYVPETQIGLAHKEQVTIFLHESQANMAEQEKYDDNDVDLFPNKYF